MIINNSNILNLNVTSGIVPGWLSKKSLALFVLLLLIFFVLWPDYTLPVNFLFVSLSSVLLFFIGGCQFSIAWKNVSHRQYIKNIFLLAVLVRLTWIIYTYFFNIGYFGTPIGDTADTEFYMSIGKEFAASLNNFDFSCFNRWLNSYDISIDDIGYPIFLGVVYFLSFNISDVFVPFVIKSILGAYTCVFVFKITDKHFGYGAAKLAALFCALNPNMIWWCGSLMKETEMVFFSVLFLLLADNIVNSKLIRFKDLLILSIVGLYVFMYRSALGAVAFMSLLLTVLFIPSKFFSLNKKIISSIIVSLIIVLSLGNVIYSKTFEMYDNVRNGGQETNMEWRSKRVGGNAFAKYAGVAVFAPLIFTIPFPTLVSANQYQYSQMQMSGGNYIKNILSSFCILFIISIIFSGQWKNHVLPLSFMISYLTVLVLSGYAQSGRFHMPIWPLEMMFAACGIQYINKRQIKWFNYVLAIEFIACIAWQWFKLKGRGLI